MLQLERSPPDCSCAISGWDISSRYFVTKTTNFVTSESIHVRACMHNTLSYTQAITDASVHPSMWSHTHTPSPSQLSLNSPPHNGSFHSLTSPALINSPSPVTHDCQSPHFKITPNRGGGGGGGFGGNYCAHSMDMNRRSSLQHVNTSLMRSEPNLHRRSSLDPVALQRFASSTNSFDFLHGSTPSLNQLPPLHLQSPPSFLPTHSSPHGSTSQLSKQGSDSSLNELPIPEFSFPKSIIRLDKSLSMDNICSDAIGPLVSRQQPQKRRQSFGFSMSSGRLKRPR